jgi:hypoxanthine phosphoribosyltransferase
MLLGEILLTEDMIGARVAELGALISTEYQEKDLLIVGVLRGSFMFVADLVRKISIPLALDFVGYSSYGTSTESSQTITVTKALQEDVSNRHVLIVEDIIDTGYTLSGSGLIDLLKDRGAASVKICTLLDKPSRRRVQIVPDFTGFTIPDEFVVGYGLDYNGLFRNLPFISLLNLRDCVKQVDNGQKRRQFSDFD